MLKKILEKLAVELEYTTAEDTTANKRIDYKQFEAYGVSTKVLDAGNTVIEMDGESLQPFGAARKSSVCIKKRGERKK